MNRLKYFASKERFSFHSRTQFNLLFSLSQFYSSFIVQTSETHNAERKCCVENNERFLGFEGNFYDRPNCNKMINLFVKYILSVRKKSSSVLTFNSKQCHCRE